MFETISNTEPNFLNLHIDKATKTRGDKQLYLITHFTKQTLNLNYLLLTFWRVKTGVGEYILRVTQLNGKCSQNLVSNPAQSVSFMLDNSSVQPR